MIRMTKGLVLFTGSFNEVTRESVRWYKRGGSRFVYSLRNRKFLQLLFCMILSVLLFSG